MHDKFTVIDGREVWTGSMNYTVNDAYFNDNNLIRLRDSAAAQAYAAEFDEMFNQLEIAIHQFAKRQMTWFRGMEKRGTKIHWIDGHLPMEVKINVIVELMNQ